MDFNINLPINVISGKDAVINNSAQLKKLGAVCLIVTGGKSAKANGALDDMTTALTKEGITFSVYDKIGPNPRLDHCFEAGRLAQELKAEFIVGIGGGSALDAAKAVAVYASNPDISMEAIYTATERSRALPLVLVGTTSGTGSEANALSPPPRRTE